MFAMQRRGSEAVIRTLVKAGADIDTIKNIFNKTARETAILMGYSQDLLFVPEGVDTDNQALLADAGEGGAAAPAVAAPPVPDPVPQIMPDAVPAEAVGRPSSADSRNY